MLIKVFVFITAIALIITIIRILKMNDCNNTLVKKKICNPLENFTISELKNKRKEFQQTKKILVLNFCEKRPDEQQKIINQLKKINSKLEFIDQEIAERFDYLNYQ